MCQPTPGVSVCLEQCWGDLQALGDSEASPGGISQPGAISESGAMQGSSAHATKVADAKPRNTGHDTVSRFNSADHPSPGLRRGPNVLEVGGVQVPEVGGLHEVHPPTAQPSLPQRVGDVISFSSHSENAQGPSTLAASSKAETLLSLVPASAGQGLPGADEGQQQRPASSPAAHPATQALHHEHVPSHTLPAGQQQQGPPASHRSPGLSAGVVSPAMHGALASLHSLRRHVTSLNDESTPAAQRRTSPGLHGLQPPVKSIGAVASVASSLFGSAARFFSSGDTAAAAGTEKRAPSDRSLAAIRTQRRHSSAVPRSRTASAPLQPSGSLLGALRVGSTAAQQQQSHGGSNQVRQPQTAVVPTGNVATRQRASTFVDTDGPDLLNPFGSSPVKKLTPINPRSPAAPQATSSRAKPPVSPAPRARTVQGFPVVLNDYVPGGEGGSSVQLGASSAQGQLGASAPSTAVMHNSHSDLYDSTLAAAAPCVHVNTEPRTAARPTTAATVRVRSQANNLGAVDSSGAVTVHGIVQHSSDHVDAEAGSAAGAATATHRPVSGPATRRLPLPVVAAYVATQLQAVNARIPVPQWRALAEASGTMNALAVAARCMRLRLQTYFAKRCPWAKVDILSGRQGKFRIQQKNGRPGPVQTLPRTVFEICTEVPSTTGGFMSFTTTRDFFKGSSDSHMSATSPDNMRPRTARIGFTEDSLLEESDTARHNLQSANVAVRCVMQCLVELHNMLKQCPSPSEVLLSPDCAQLDDRLSLHSPTSVASPPRSLSADTLPEGGTTQSTPERQLVYANNPFGVPAGDTAGTGGSGVEALDRPWPQTGVGLPPPVPSAGDLASLGSSEWIALSRAGSDGGDSVLGGTPARRSATAVSAMSDDLAPPSKYVRAPSTLHHSHESNADNAPDDDSSGVQPASVQATPLKLPYPIDPTAGTLQLHLPPQTWVAAFKGTPSFTLALKMRRAATGVSAFARPAGADALLFAAKMRQFASEFVEAKRLPECDAAWAQWNLAACMLSVNYRWLMQQLCAKCPWYDLADDESALSEEEEAVGTPITGPGSELGDSTETGALSP